MFKYLFASGEDELDEAGRKTGVPSFSFPIGIDNNDKNHNIRNKGFI